ncbi:MAG TPA: alpha/beta hydrolase [Nevskiaceae bacterium]
MNARIGVDAHGQRFEIEYRFVGSDAADAPWLVIMHEGLGSVAMWRDFPQRLCEACGVRGLVYSRPGYGESSRCEADRHWQPDYMHRHARHVLPALLAALHAPPRYHLLGHSDGGSIALIHAAAFPGRVASAIVLAPHILVEDISVKSIAEAKVAYRDADLRRPLARYHADVDWVFWRWNDIWLSPAFRDWSIRELLPEIRCPVLAIQGHQDPYGTMAQIDGIAAALPAGQCQLVKLDQCGHSAHRDQPDKVIEAVSGFLAAQRASATAH